MCREVYGELVRESSQGSVQVLWEMRSLQQQEGAGGELQSRKLSRRT